MSKRAYRDLLELLLRDLEKRVVDLRRRWERAEGMEKIRLSWEIGRLNREEQTLRARLRRLEAETDGLWENVKADLQSVTLDLVNAVARWVERVDTRYAASVDRRQATRSRETHD